MGITKQAWWRAARLASPPGMRAAAPISTSPPRGARRTRCRPGRALPLRAWLGAAVVLQSILAAPAGPPAGPQPPRRQRNAPVATCDWRAGAHVGGYSGIIDVRTPAEFAVDHIPGALNLPVLSGPERHQVGLLYASTHFEGRKLGAQLISANIAAVLAGHFADKPPTYCPLVYCWRGGQRSNALAHVLSEVGFRCSVLRGGYRAFRRSVVRILAHAPAALEFRVLTGPTGSGKTALLHHLARHGHQVLDLEALANHRGSVLGATGTAQPSQKAFETSLAEALLRLRPDRPVFVEDEASFIGALHIPSSLWRALLQAPRFALETLLRLRVRHTLEHYDHLTSDPEHLSSLLEKLGRYHNAPTVRRWLRLVAEGEYTVRVLRGSV